MSILKRFTPILVALLLVVSSAALSGVIRDGSFSGISNGSDITLRWVSEDESGALRYEIERKAGLNGQFVFLSQLALRGNNISYTYVDDSAFRTSESVYQYRIKVVLSSGVSVYYGPITVTHSVNSVAKRTWGSIKAMFR
ncbi:MAG: hypothetical protein HW390_3636 [Candidatus Brocadiaceae bacterium]|nr:hypothetical protein [Candidatus Brocadiaceae bacterium]